MAVSVNNLVTITNTGLAARLRAIRVRAGKSQAEIAQRLGLNEAWYADLEQRDGELAASLTLFKAMELASLFGVTLHELIGAPIIAGEAGRDHGPAGQGPGSCTAQRDFHRTTRVHGGIRFAGFSGFTCTIGRGIAAFILSESCRGARDKLAGADSREHTD
jgi:DNA-binding XRE family transcriptional regulator